MIRSALLASALIGAAPLAAAPMAAPPAATFVAKAGAGDLYEKTSSEIVLKSTRNAKIHDFATMMVSAHSKTTMAVGAAAKADGLKPSPPKLDAKQAKMIADLKAAAPAARDKLYLTQQAAAHQEALALMQAYSAGGDKPSLKKAATDTVPIVEGHISELSALGAN